VLLLVAIAGVVALSPVRSDEHMFQVLSLFSFEKNPNYSRKEFLVRQFSFFFNSTLVMLLGSKVARRDQAYDSRVWNLRVL